MFHRHRSRWGHPRCRHRLHPHPRCHRHRSPNLGNRGCHHRRCPRARWKGRRHQPHLHLRCRRHLNPGRPGRVCHRHPYLRPNLRNRPRLRPNWKIRTRRGERPRRCRQWSHHRRQPGRHHPSRFPPLRCLRRFLHFPHHQWCRQIGRRSHHLRVP